MKIQSRHIAAGLIAGLLSMNASLSLSACEFHGGGGAFDFPFASPGWNMNDYDEPADEVPPEPVKKKPVFSNAAAQASDQAKAKIKQDGKKDGVESEKAKSEAKESVDSEQAPTDQQASR